MKHNKSTILLIITIILLIMNLSLGITKGKYNLNDSNIKIMIPNYNSSNIMEYEYKVEGINDNWIECTSEEIDVDYLPCGHYNVLIRPVLYDGTAGENMVTPVDITPPFWKSKYAFLMYICLILSILIYNKKKVTYLDKIIKKRTKALVDEMDKNSALLKKVMESEKSKSCYFVNMSHELRTPINVISSTCQLVMELNNSYKGIDRDKLNHYMNVCRKNSLNLLEIINDIIDIAKMENNNYPIHIEKNDIVSLVEDSALTLKDYVEKKGIQMIIDPEIEEKIIECDKKQIERCIVNLVGNAFKFTSPGGFIKVFVKDFNDKIQIEVQDNGRGIAKENHEDIFNRFSQVSNSKSSVNRGSGLGLTITKQIIENHNGTIKVESELGKGSRFIITLPVRYIKDDNKEEKAV